MAGEGERKTATAEEIDGSPLWRLLDGGVEIAVTLEEVAIRTASHPARVAVFTREEWRALAVHIAGRPNV